MGLVNTIVPWFSVVDNAVLYGVATSGSANRTTGDKFSVTRALTMIGVRFYWKTAGASRTVRCTLWESSTAIRTVDLTVNATAVYTGTFLSSLVLSPYQGYAATIWDISGTNYTFIDATASGPNGPAPVVGQTMINGYCIGRGFQRFSTGNVVPNNDSPSEIFPVEPILSAYNLVDGALA